jgi:hypothetical protein
MEYAYTGKNFPRPLIATTTLLRGCWGKLTTSCRGLTLTCAFLLALRDYAKDRSCKTKIASVLLLEEISLHIADK